jgi:hypothetical protein
VEIRWYPAREITGEANELAEDAFAGRHPGLAVVAESLGPESAKSTGVSGAARICWPEAKDQPRLRFGRSPGWAWVVLPHPRVSKEHLTLTGMDGSPGRWGVMDHGSTNGTYVRGQRIAPHSLVEIASGEPVELAGVVRLRFYHDPSALRSALGAHEPSTTSVTCRDELPRLASVMRALGFDAECVESEGDVRVQSQRDEIRIRVKGAVYVVECTRDGLCLKSDTTPTYGKDAEEALRDLVLKHLGFGRTADPLRETQHGSDFH